MNTNTAQTGPKPGSNGPMGKICFVYKEDYPWDVRVEKIVKTLTMANYQVTLICRNNKRLPLQESLEGFQIRRIPCLPRIFGKLNNLISVPFYLNPFWLYWIFRYSRQAKANALIVRDLPLMPIGVIVGKILNLKIFFDMAECYPEMYASTLEYSDRKLLKFLFKNPWIAGVFEKVCFNHVDRIFVMIEESRDRLLRLGADSKKIIIVSNTPQPKPRESVRIHGEQTQLRLFYVGFITRIRGLDNVLLGLRKYLNDGGSESDLRFDVVGVGSGMQFFQSMCESLALENVVKFHGWCDQFFVDELYENSDVGILTYHDCTHWNHTIPNKLFDYMATGIPVLSTNIKPIERILETTGCGLVFPDNDPDAFVGCLKKLFSPKIRNEMGEKGVNAVRSTYNWEIDSKRMLQCMKDILQ